jgi:membrane fusion protein (multidrug efflux system)
MITQHDTSDTRSMSGNALSRVTRWILLFAACAAILGCESRAKPAPPPPPQVSVIEVKPGPVTVYDEYIGQTQAPGTIEIRSQVTGLVERQAFTDGARVKKGDVLYVIDQRPFEAQLEQARANLAQAQANLLNAQQNLARNVRLIEQHGVSQQDYDSAVAQERSATALVEAQKTLLTTLYSSDPMWVNFTMSEYKLLEVQTRLKRALGESSDNAPAFRLKLADGTDYPFPGKFDFVDATVDQKSGTLNARISVPNPERALRPGLFVRVIVPGLENPTAIRIPQRAVQELQGLKSVYVVSPDGKAETRQIAASSRVGNDWVVDSGLRPRDRVVVEGLSKLKPGMLVKATIAASTSAVTMASSAVDQAPGK